jgi:hypothetical protein
MPHRRAKRPQATDTSRRARLRWRRSPRAGDGNRAALPWRAPFAPRWRRTWGRHAAALTAAADDLRRRHVAAFQL